MKPLAWIGIIVVAILGASMIGCVSCVALFSSGANQVSKQMQLAEDQSENPAKYTTADSQVEVVKAAIGENQYGSQYVRIIVKNSSGQDVKSVVVHVETEDEYGKQTWAFDSGDYKVVEPEKPLPDGKTAEGEFYHHGSKIVRKANVIKVLYADGKVWPDDFSKLEPSGATSP